MALGASRRDVIRPIIKQAAALSLIGMAVGIGLAYALGRAAADQLFGVSGSDPATYLLVSILFIVVAVAASYIPARRATGVDPTQALRSE